MDLPVTDFNRVQSVALGGKNVQSVAFFGQNTVAWQALGGEAWDLTVLDGYETPIKDGFLNDVVAGDLTGTGRKDLVFLETAKNYLDIVAFDSNHKWFPPNAGRCLSNTRFAPVKMHCQNRARRSSQTSPVTKKTI